MRCHCQLCRLPFPLSLKRFIGHPLVLCCRSTKSIGKHTRLRYAIVYASTIITPRSDPVDRFQLTSFILFPLLFSFHINNSLAKRKRRWLRNPTAINAGDIAPHRGANHQLHETDAGGKINSTCFGIYCRQLTRSCSLFLFFIETIPSPFDPIHILQTKRSYLKMEAQSTPQSTDKGEKNRSFS